MGNKISHRRRPAVDERYTRPQGLYPCRDVDQRKLRRLILDSKLAPCVPGQEDPDATDLEECPICFLHYPTLNRSKCCVKGICTECFLQLKAPHARATQCPFCKTPGYAVEYRGAKTLEEKGLEQAEEQKVIEAKIRMRLQEAQEDEDRAKRRKEDQRLGRSVISHHPRSITPVEEDYEDLTWNSEEDLTWNSAPSQDLRFGSELTFSERTTSGMDPYQRAAPFQQSAVSVASNFMNHQQHEQQQTEIEFRSPARFPQRREDEFDLDLEDIMVMEAIWLSIQEQGARHRFADIVEEGSEIIEADVGLAGAIAAMVEHQAVNHQRTIPTINHPVEEEEAAHDEEQPTTGESTTTATITTQSPTQDPSETSSSSSATGAADEEQSKRFDDACEINNASNEDKVVLPEQMTLVMPKPVQ